MGLEGVIFDGGGMDVSDWGSNNRGYGELGKGSVEFCDGFILGLCCVYMYELYSKI